MGQRKNNSGSVKKISHSGKECFFANLNLSPQPIVCLPRLNIPETLKNGKTNGFSVNVNSESFKQLLLNINTHKVKAKKITSKALKPKTKERKNKNQSLVGSQSDSFMTNETENENLSVPIAENDNELFTDESCLPNNELECTTQTGDKENLLSQDFGSEVTDEDTHYEDNPTESITRTDKVIDTFLHVLRKTTDDNSILSALQRDYICDHCQRGFLKKNSLRKHMIICLGEKKSKRRKKEGNYSCPMCGITYLNKYSLDKHNANVHNLKKMYKCLVCSQHFYNEETLTLHCRSRHGLGGSDIYKCPYCEATFNLRGDLNYHCRRAHNTTRYYICPTCLECFKSEDTCKLHEQSHGYCCDICMFKTKTESEMIAHRSTHLYMVVHKCDKCLRTFKAKRDFTKHINVHEREKKQ